MSASGAITVARQKEGAGSKTAPVKMESSLVRKARAIADDKGVDLSAYVSGIVRPVIERDWSKVLKKIVESDESGE
jgi:hypothetical protein